MEDADTEQRDKRHRRSAYYDRPIKLNRRVMIRVKSESWQRFLGVAHSERTTASHLLRYVIENWNPKPKADNASQAQAAQAST